MTGEAGTGKLPGVGDAGANGCRVGTGGREPRRGGKDCRGVSDSGVSVKTQRKKLTIDRGCRRFHRWLARVVLAGCCCSASSLARSSSTVLNSADRPAKPGQGSFAFIRASRTVAKPTRVESFSKRPSVEFSSKKKILNVGNIAKIAFAKLELLQASITNVSCRRTVNSCRWSGLATS